jgi:MFS transporter, PPP family, 3-phenylpropionic acid transporter
MAGPMSASTRGGLTPFVILYAALYAGFGMVSPFLPILLEKRGLQADQIGLTLALATAVRLVSGPVSGRVADAHNALRTVFACFAAAAAATGLGYLLAAGFVNTLIVSVLYAAMLAPLTTTADALALGAAAGGGKRRFEYGWVRGAGSAAFIVGSIVAGRVIVAISLDAIIWGGSAFLLAAAVGTIGLSTPHKSAGASLARVSAWSLLQLQEFRLLLAIAALVLGSHAMHDSFAMIRWQAAGIAPPSASLLWSESVGAEVLVFLVIGPRLLHRIGSTAAMAIAAVAGALRWSTFAMTANVAAMATVEPLHGLSFALLHLACMQVIGRIVPGSLAATAQAIYGTLAVGAVTSVLTLASGTLYGGFGAAAFWVMAALCVVALPFIFRLRSVSARRDQSRGSS